MAAGSAFHAAERAREVDFCDCGGAIMAGACDFRRVEVGRVILINSFAVAHFDVVMMKYDLIVFASLQVGECMRNVIVMQVPRGNKEKSINTYGETRRTFEWQPEAVPWLTSGPSIIF
jgi:hypothetical protein